MDAFVNSIVNSDSTNESVKTSYNRLLYGIDSLTDTYYPDWSAPITLPVIPSEETIKRWREKGIIGTNDYPVFERGLNPSFIGKLEPPYDNLYKNIPPESTISNKVRVMPNPKNKKINIPPQNINDALKPLNKRFKYFVKPTYSYETQSLLDTASDQSMIKDIDTLIREAALNALKKQIANDKDKDETDNEQNGKTLQKRSTEEEQSNDNPSSDEEQQSPSMDFTHIYVPPEFYKREWHVFNKQFLLNRIKNSAKGNTSSGAANLFVDPTIFRELKRLYPNASDYVLRSDYNMLIKKHKLIDLPSTETVSEKLIRTNSVIARLAALLNGVVNRDQLYKKINEIIMNIPFSYLVSKFPSINRSIIQSNVEIYKLAFVCGSTNETIITDAADISNYIETLNRQ